MKSNELINILESPYTEENFRSLAKAIFKTNITKMVYREKIEENSVESAYIKSFSQLYHYENDLENILVLSINLKKNTTVKRARTAQRNFIAKILENNSYDGALVAFYNDDHLEEWRLSFIKFEYIFEKGSIKKEITLPKRSSFLVGKSEPSHTAKKQLLSLIQQENISLNILEESFGIESVTKEFFERYKEKYLELNDLLQSNGEFMNLAEEKRFSSSEFAKKLLGQIVFLYFLQKKGWLGVPALPDKLTKEEYLNIMENLEDENSRTTLSKIYKFYDSLYFFDTNKAVAIKKSDLNNLVLQFKGTIYFKTFGYGDKDFLRTIFKKMSPNENYFENILEPLFYEALNLKRGSANYYPLLNSRIPFLNGGLFEPLENYKWKDIKFNIPNTFFVNDEKNGLFDIFDLFNFTVNESDPLEQEVAIDPEMLGKIFENLLEINNRKDSGSYYTPREIVHFMCQDSIAQYLSNKLNVSLEKVKTFVYMGEMVENESYREEFDNELLEKAFLIDDYLKNVKIVDPAVGSGAFALGMLTQIVKIRSNLTPILVKNLKDDECSLFERQRSIYNLKLESMQNNIFAVDIDYSAADITKLRLWLSLIVDNEIDTVNPLPNLDHNVRVGNSLIDEFKGIKLFDRKKFRRTKKKSEIELDSISGLIQLNLFSDSSEELLESLNKLQKYLFKTHDKDVKDLIKNKIEELEWGMLEYVLLENAKNKLEVLTEFNEFRKSRSKPFFLWERDFSEIFDFNGGFDIVIGNPPYGAKLSKEDKKTIKKWMKDTNNNNTAALFIDFSKNYLLRKDGVLTFIVPKSLLYSEKWFSLVKSLYKKTSVIVDVEKAFEKVKLEQVVFLYNQGQNNQKKYEAKKFLNNEFVNTLSIDTNLVDSLEAWVCDINQKDLSIINSLKRNLISLTDISTTKRGVGIQKYLEDENDIPVIGGKNIDRYFQNGIKGYVSQNVFAENSSKLEFMKNVKIMSQDLIGHIQNPIPHIKIKSCIDRTGEILNLDTVQNTIIHDENYTLEYVVALLNSNFVNWYTYKFIYSSAIRTMHFDKNYIGKIKIPIISKKDQQPFVNLVRQIENLKGITGEITDLLEYDVLTSTLNNLVYEAYKVPSNDIEYIESQFKKLN